MIGANRNKMVEKEIEKLQDLPVSDKITKLSELQLTDRQHRWLQVYIEKRFNITAASKKAKITRTTFYEWKSNYPHFAKAIDMCRKMFVDDIETAFNDLVKEKNPQAVMFGLKTLGKDRGYAEKKDLDLTGVKAIQVVFDEVKEVTEE